MTQDAKSPREERLAASLRANLHRRKAQARAMAAASDAGADAEAGGAPSLPKETPRR
ncbi:hypothetical protein [Tsuneonella aeria]|uniref:hypothetical protein n=1 Tax=Tsuneonella aeria TaxID=1837929 RepID=UPI001925B86B|nr:hypothetical protein [Tsuneonella aeria]